MSKDERKFNDVVNSIKVSENDVDKVLKAARLLRNESCRLEACQKFEIINNILLLIGALGFIAIVLTFLYFCATH